MPDFLVTNPEGQKFKITAPEGATQDQALAYAQAKFSAAPKAAPPSVSPGVARTVMDQGLQGATYGFSDEVSDALGAVGTGAVLGAKDVFGTGGYEAETIPKLYGEARASSKERLAAEEKEHPYLSGAAQLAGAIAVPGVGEAKLLKAALPEAIAGSKAAGRIAKGTVGGGAGGAAYGAGSADDGKRLEGAKKGAEAGVLTGLAGGTALEGAAKVAAPAFKKSVDLLRKEGVLLTPGQLAQGAVKSGESAATSLPLVGDMIKHGQRSSIESFNTAVWNRALKPIGGKVPKDVPPGPDSVRYVGGVIGKKYDALIPKLTLQLDSSALQASKDLHDTTVSRLTEPMQKQFESLVDGIVGTRLDDQFRMSGEDFKRIDSELGYEARRYSKSENPEHQGLGDALTQARGILRDTLERSNPKYAQELKAIHSAWAIYKRAEAASIRRVGAQGIFTPGDLLADIRKTSTSGTFARGDGLVQDLASAGQEILPSNVPDSGSIGRGLWTMALTGGASVNPAVAAGAAGASTAYTKPGMRALSTLGAGPKSAKTRAAIEGASPALAAGAGTEAGEQREQAP